MKRHESLQTSQDRHDGATLREFGTFLLPKQRWRSIQVLPVGFMEDLKWLSIVTHRVPIRFVKTQQTPSRICSRDRSFSCWEKKFNRCHRTRDEFRARTRNRATVASSTLYTCGGFSQPDQFYCCADETRRLVTVRTDDCPFDRQCNGKFQRKLTLRITIAKGYQCGTEKCDFKV
jgi:hypothetical protein